jgi:hypothetical protein
MLSFEQEIKEYLKAKGIAYIDNSSEFKLLDFTIPDFVIEKSDGKNVGRKLFLEVKEKRQVYNISNWPLIQLVDEPFTFIVDELSCRKALAYAPFSGLLIRDNMTGFYYWYSVLDLFLMPKKRVNRPIQKNATKTLKGKIILDFRNAVKSDNLEEIIMKLKESITNRHHLYTEVNECYGTYHDEIITTQGITREEKHWDTDVSETR